MPAWHAHHCHYREFHLFIIKKKNRLVWHSRQTAGAYEYTLFFLLLLSIVSNVYYYSDAHSNQNLIVFGIACVCVRSCEIRENIQIWIVNDTAVPFMWQREMVMATVDSSMSDESKLDDWLFESWRVQLRCLQFRQDDLMDSMLIVIVIWRRFFSSNY